MKAIVFSIFTMLTMLTMFSFGQEFKAGDITTAKDQKPTCKKVSYNSETYELKLKVTDTGDNEGLKSLNIDGIIIPFEGVTDTVITKRIWPSLVSYQVEDIGGNKTTGEFKLKEKDKYDEIFIVPSFGIGGIGSCLAHKDVSLCLGLKTEADMNYFYKYQGIMMSYRYYNYDSVSYSEEGIEAGYIFGKANSKGYADICVKGYGYEFAPFAKYSIKNDAIGFGANASVYANLLILEFENKLSSEYISGNVNYLNKTSIGASIVFMEMNVAYEFGSFYGSKFNYFSVGCAMYIPLYSGYRPKHKQLESFN